MFEEDVEIDPEDLPDEDDDMEEFEEDEDEDDGMLW